MSGAKEAYIPEVNTLIKDIPDEIYHGMKGSFSSSQLKDILDEGSEETFHKKYITGEIPRMHISAFDVGTYFHTAVLEPEKFDATCAVYDGIRKGAKWDTFQKENEGKTIITKSEAAKADGIIKVVKESKMAMHYINNSDAEVSAFIEVYVYGGEIYSMKTMKAKEIHRLGRDGWVEEKISAKALKAIQLKGVLLVLKVRADSLGEDFIADLKSTNGNVKCPKELAKKVESYNYELSASLYLDVFSFVTGRDIKQFIWIWGSKDKLLCQSSMATEKNIRIGRAKWKKAVLNLAAAIADDWKSAQEERMLMVDPTPWGAVEWDRVETKEEDEL